MPQALPPLLRIALPLGSNDGGEEGGGVAGMADGVGHLAEEDQGHQGCQRRFNQRPQGPALPHLGGGL